MALCRGLRDREKFGSKMGLTRVYSVFIKVLNHRSILYVSLWLESQTSALLCFSNEELGLGISDVTSKEQSLSMGK